MRNIINFRSKSGFPFTFAAAYIFYTGIIENSR